MGTLLEKSDFDREFPRGNVPWNRVNPENQGQFNLENEEDYHTSTHLTLKILTALIESSSENVT